MRKLYYRIMISSIYTAQNNGIMSDIWKFTSSLYFAFATAIYSMFFYLLLNDYIIPNHLTFLNLKIIKGDYNFILNMFIYFIIPIMIMNYFIFFKNDNYKSLIKIYNKEYNKKYFAIYFSLGFLLMFVSLFLKK